MSGMTTVPDVSTTKVSMAVRLHDEFTGSGRALGNVVVSIRDRARHPVRNRSGYHVFMDLASGDVVIQVRSKWYLDEDRDLRLPLSDRLNPLLEVSLKPNWLYPFPRNVTLIRGLVQDVHGSPVPAARVEFLTLAGKQVENRTDSGGRFVLFITGLLEDDVQADGQDQVLVTGTGAKDFQLRTSCIGYDPAVTGITHIIEGQTFLLTNPITLQKT